MSGRDFNQVLDELRSAFEEVGIEDGYDIVAQATLLLAVRRLDIIHTATEGKANITGEPIHNPIFDRRNEPSSLVKAEEHRCELDVHSVRDRSCPFIRERGRTPPKRFPRSLRPEH